MKEWYGWTPDLPDPRDIPFTLPETKKKLTLPPHIDLRPKMPTEIYNQGALGSCTANAIGVLCQFRALQETSELLHDRCPSRLFIYYNERWLEGSVGSDSGAQIRDGLKALNKWGIVAEELWPYDIHQFTKQPPPSVYDAAKKEIVRKYARVPQTLDDLRACLAHGGPVVFGFTVFESFETAEVARTGLVQLPDWKNGDQPVGGHAVCLCGYDDDAQRFLVRNSWGADWGMGGYFSMPYEYVTSRYLAADFWTIAEV